MSHFIQHTILDMRTGRDSWRVFLSLGAIAFSFAIAMKLI